ncbi:bifunctional 2',3'-cyclic-nucleotide 2'-phosphodiesterase/3'-nucleotidase [Paenibacillus tarimensis]|uniref:bifunctional 2',3'-cyclic-nucleotide 2'-phosphodiesterase/3'-nucleotidase n=1 Tax=Paenibacillus tarimensis TaxID=416012 RepID=UPI001F3D4AA4|nr:bifunctional 2',3'-cyclic-nucleotide 2'-phosphodiesterase/3'-nucleotidase [Paenibacillus tarimensis]MCF2943302.1 bifunctional 2',3'-cyclic-nucleotide 2'-phosphodiesterase/3'-nucleotidase [Paenibacillus tarimensis]
MKKTWKLVLTWALVTQLALVNVLTAGAAEDTASGKAGQVKLRLLETSDIHMEIMNYDYYKDEVTHEFGLVKVATLIKQARQEEPNSMLFDNGDLIQGNPMGDYMARVNKLSDKDAVHPVYKAMNLLNYDAATVGNHEFNYGLDYLQRAMKGAEFPYATANVYVDDKDGNPDNDKNYFTPYLMLDRTFKDEAGQDVKLKVGVIGFVTPQIMMWDQTHLAGKVIAKDIIETAKKFVPKMKEEGADVIVAMLHSGMGDTENNGEEENTAWLLSQEVPGFDAILFGHSHVVFPSASFAGMKGVDEKKGTVNGVAAVEPGYWGSHLGVIDLTLEQQNGDWTVVDSKSEARPIAQKVDGVVKPLVESDPEIVAAVKDEHEATLKYIRGPVGTITQPINSYFALVKDDPSVQIVTSAQKWYVERAIKGTDLEGTPILSAGAPFKAGGMDPEYYTNIPAGTIAIKNVADLYVYPNTLKAVLLNGEQVREWLERSAGQFNQIDPSVKTEQPLINTNFRTYNFDIIDGVSYQIDVTQPSRYDMEGKLANEKAHRIVNLKYNGKPVTEDMKFIVATNNYRAGGGGSFPGLDGSNIVVDSPDETRQVIIDYIQSQGKFNPSADGNWSLAPIKGDVNVTFLTSPKAADLATAAASTMAWVGNEESGFAKYKLNMSSSAAQGSDGTSGEETAPVEQKPQAASKPAGKADSGKTSPTETGSKGAPGKADKAESTKGNAAAVKHITYIVEEGDWLSKIARKYGTTWQELAEYNKLNNPDRLYPGQKLLIPVTA